jgi:hypothetical protein
LYAGLGAVIGLGANPRASLDGSRTFAMDEEDHGGYRRIMRQNLVSFGRRPR